MGGSRRTWWISGFVSIIALLCAGSVLLRNWYVATKSAEEQAKAEAWVNQQADVGSWPDAQRALADHAAALVEGNEQRWLAAVDPSQAQLRNYYQRLYAAMRELNVTGWAYHTSIPPVTAFGRSVIDTVVTVTYCLAIPQCPQEDPREGSGLELPEIKQHITVDRRQGRYVITDVEQLGDLPPWQKADLHFVSGSRVVVGAPAGQRGRLHQVAAAAEAAAVEADRFTHYTGVKPAQYNVYLAGDEEWASWYGGLDRKWAIGYARPTGRLGTDVVLKMSALRDPDYLAITLRHEFGHVVTLGGADLTSELIIDFDQWLEEGVAEYIGYTPRNKLADGRVSPLRSAGKIPDDIRLEPLAKDASDAEVDRTYGYGYLAVHCMVSRYGEARTMTFVNAVLREQKQEEAAARQAFGVPFTTVNKACTSYFRTVVG